MTKTSPNKEQVDKEKNKRNTLKASPLRGDAESDASLVPPAGEVKTSAACWQGSSENLSRTPTASLILKNGKIGSKSSTRRGTLMIPMRRERDVSQTILITTSMTLPDDDNPRWRLPLRG